MSFYAIIHDAANKCWLEFSRPVEVLRTCDAAGVADALQRVDKLTKNEGKWAAGFISYEAGNAFDSALPAKDSDFPMVAFGIFNQPVHIDSPECFNAAANMQGSWASEVSQQKYDESIARIKQLISAGETYQVNYTFRMRQDFDPADSIELFAAMTASQQGDYGAFLRLDDYAICSASPELFFSKCDNILRCKPMKGTAHRGLTASDDIAAGEALGKCQKNLAENVMIVDMMRNDLGKIARPGSVEADELFAVERFPTLWQMTSSLRAVSDAGLYEIMAAMFPCASITGAPKRRTMEIIDELEISPRKIYTGSIGFVNPDGRMQFNVAIRTVLVDMAAGEAEYGVGGGVVWDSCNKSEYDECLLKARVLAADVGKDFELLETMLWENGEFYLLERHISRLAESAEYFGFKLDIVMLRAMLDDHVMDSQDNESLRVRLTLSRGGEITIGAYPFDPDVSGEPVKVAFAAEPVDKSCVYLYHKTTMRDVYQQARNGCGGVDDVILYNSDGLVTESTIANVVVEIDGQLLTPKISAGLLGGTLREELIESGEITPADITREMLENAEEIWLINSLRKWRKASFK